jgi:N-acetylglucosamine-6-sulfatase
LRRVIPILAALAAVVCLLVGTEAAERQPLAQEQPSPKPNVLFILTDDQSTEDLAAMNNVQSLLVDEGTNFENAFATTPLCCPSRVSFMRGQYVHNHGVLTNGDTTEGGYEKPGGYKRFADLGLQNSTVATWLHDAGYSTFYAGKFLNGYQGTTHVPPGWDTWYAFSDRRPNETSYTVNENGTLKTYSQAQQHETYYLRDRTEGFIHSHAEKGPWFAWVSTHAPHPPITVAPEFQNSYDNVQMPKPPSYNEADVNDKPTWMQRQPLLDDDCSTGEGEVDCHQQAVEKWRTRQESLMSVDLMVGDLIGALAETNQLERTYIVFASDNGYMLYRHRVYAKGTPYEESQGIPFVVRGPGVRQGVVSKELVANIDLAPTIAEWTGVEAPNYVDGRSLTPLLAGAPAPSLREYMDGRSLARLLEGASAPSWRERLLFDNSGGSGGKKVYAGVRTAEGETYVEHDQTDEKEYYDLRTDPWQLDSGDAAAENAERIGTLSAVLSDLRSCEGAGCRAAERSCSADQTDNDADGVVDEPGEPCGDPSPLDTTINSVPPSLTDSRSARFTFSSDEPGATTFECSLDSSGLEFSFRACSSGVTYNELADGSHIFRVRARNQEAGTVEPDPARYAWTVDTTAPLPPTISSPAEGSRHNSGSFTLSGTAEAGSTVELFEGADSKGTAQSELSSGGSWSVSLSGVSEGSHTYTAKATDSVGHTSEASSTRTVIVDTSAPKVTSVVPAEDARSVLATTDVHAFLSEAMDEASVEVTDPATGKPAAFTLTQKTRDSRSAPLVATVSYAETEKGHEAILDPAKDLQPGATYIATLSSKAEDAAGNKLDQDSSVSGTQAKVWRFKVKR